MELRHLLDLPGPGRFVDDVLHLIDGGHSVVLVFPAAAVDTGLADLVLRRISDASAAVDCPPADGVPGVVQLVVDAVGDDGTWNPGGSPLKSLAVWPRVRGTVIVLRSWYQVLRQLVTRWPAFLMEAALDAADRPRLVLAVRRCDIDEPSLDHLDALLVKQRWWWGVLDRLDTEVHLFRTMRSESRQDPLRSSVISEIAAWDLALADHLAHAWDGDPASLRETIHQLAAAVRTDRVGNAAGHGVVAASTGSRPAPVLRDDWDAGHLELWSGIPRRRLTDAVTDAGLAPLVWRAQSRQLFSQLDQRRTELETVFRRYAPTVVLNRLSTISNAGGVLELGEMWATVERREVNLPARYRDALRRARDIRNALAHHLPVGADQLRHLARQLE